jgi:16S rRNA (cytidine1402-2'-O)-methyltransferase
LLTVLILAATPIGNIADASRRLISTIEQATDIACEDTRVFRQLCQALGVKSAARAHSLHEHNEREKLELLLRLAADTDLVVLSDAGMPTISDPGYILVRQAVERGIQVSVIPGPSAVLSGLAISGLPTDSFSFLGFLPRKSGERRSLFESVRNLGHTLIFFESPHRIAQSLEDAAEVLGNRSAAVAREITKKFEEVKRGTLTELADWAQKEIKGEVVLLIEGASATDLDYELLAQDAIRLAARGLSMKDACASVSELKGGSKNEIYEHVLRQKA